MTHLSETVILWTPRILGILVAVFVGLFAFDAFNEGKTFLQSLADFAIHLIPTFMLLAIVALSWHRAWVGGVLFLALAAGYGFVARDHLSWILTLSGPLAGVGALFLWSWRRQHATRAHA